MYRHLVTTRHLKTLNAELISVPEHRADENEEVGLVKSPNDLFLCLWSVHCSEKAYSGI